MKWKNMITMIIPARLLVSENALVLWYPPAWPEYPLQPRKVTAVTSTGKWLNKEKPISEEIGSTRA